jgi:hypothetical protein
MVKQTSQKNEAILNLVAQHDDAIKKIKNATKGLRKVESAIRTWVGNQLESTYAQWLPRIGEVAVYVVVSEASTFAYKLYVRELHGTWVRFNEGENSHAYTRFDLGNYQKYFKDGKEDTSVEFIVPALVYEQQARHWFGLPKLDKLE